MARKAAARPRPAARHWSDVVADEVRSLEVVAEVAPKEFYRGVGHEDAKRMLVVLDDLRRRVAALIRA